MQSKTMSFWTGAALGGFAVLAMLVVGLSTTWVLVIWLGVCAVGPAVTEAYR